MKRKKKAAARVWHKSATISARLPPRLIERMDKLAAEAGITRCEFMRRRIEAAIGDPALMEAATAQQRDMEFRMAGRRLSHSLRAAAREAAEMEALLAELPEDVRREVAANADPAAARERASLVRQIEASTQKLSTEQE